MWKCVWAPYLSHSRHLATLPPWFFDLVEPGLARKFQQELRCVVWDPSFAMVSDWEGRGGIAQDTPKRRLVGGNAISINYIVIYSCPEVRQKRSSAEKRYHVGILRSQEHPQRVNDPSLPSESFSRRTNTTVEHAPKFPWDQGDSFNLFKTF